ncbi:PadR family transcriptional regulator [Collinsella sp. zg1085]|uniref:PadR family transcriptional regulator n=1 Tax=Collinsella sp. zg1085 TaxID=2844380 RepID=UPI001C0CEB9D|nr:PadR family transcriptional regulator [Collinsella sp. zg1085]QWT17359.1 PadR family transcriptional regulator [Collinsella sp. zg1085]
MDTQIKRGFLEACVLAALSKGESYGYRIIKDVPAVLELTESTLYPVLKRLEAAQAISAHSVEHNGRLRKYYGLTQTGRNQLSTFIAEWQQIDDIREFLFNAKESL